MKKEYFNIPNLLSSARLIFLPLLFYFVLNDMPIAFLIGFILVGSTDFFDGLIAKKFNMQTSFGKMLDSVADIFFYFSTCWFFFVLYPEYLVPNTVILIVFFAVYLASFIVSIIRLKKPIQMHTSILRYNAVLVYALIILSYFIDTTYLVTLILTVFIVGFLEEIWIFIKFGHVDVDTKSIFCLFKEQKKDQ
ncbi:MAG: CDP-alcohol phosphatidyltransferase family protein [Acholeplasmataceae bacterium]